MKPLQITRLDASDAAFAARLDALLAWEEESRPEIATAVSEIIADVRARGDAAVLDCTRRFDRVDEVALSALEVTADDMAAALNGLAPDLRQALEHAAQRVRDYHQRQVQPDWQFEDQAGNVLGQRITPLDRVGVYVPGGKASYPSSVLMNAIPARVAGVREVVLVAPAPGGQINPLVLAAAQLAGVDRFFRIGGAQAVAALAYGTETIPPVDKIVGPGNIYVATAKRMVFGRVGIDMIAGPSEILVVCDGQTDPAWIARDLFSQAEHDEDAQAILVSPDGAFLDRVSRAMDELLAELPRAAIVRASMERRGALIRVRDLDQAIEIVNRVAPEHLELSVADPQALLQQVRHAGAIFMGRYAAEALGDYCAGPNHVLPTAGTARFFSPLGVYDFQKRSSLLEISAAGATELGRTASLLAREEGLQAHAMSAECRIGTNGDD